MYIHSLGTDTDSGDDNAGEMDLDETNNTHIKRVRSSSTRTPGIIKTSL